MKLIYLRYFPFILFLAQAIPAQILITFDDQGWDSDQSLDSIFTIENFQYSGSKNFYTNYGYNFDVYNVSIYFVFQEPSTDKFTVTTLDNEFFSLNSIATYQVSELNTDTLIIEGWNGVNKKYTKGFSNFSKWQTLNLDYENINKIVIKVSTSNKKGLVDFNFDNFLLNPLIISESETMSALPGNWDLSQNYPNPFNPSTVINYRIPKKSFITIKVYDIIGNEISTLVNEEKDAGNYSVVFIDKKLPTGIYIYQLSSNEFVSTKKMLLIK